ncbi:MAG: DoxX family membrane protein [Gemmatimonadales bacterium]
MHRLTQISRAGFASAMISLGVMGLMFRDFPAIWGALPGGNPGGATLASIAAILALAIGIGLVIPRMAAAASLTFFIYAALWWVVLQVPPVLQQPGTEGTWLDCGMYAMLVIGAWTLYTVSGDHRFPGDERGRNLARQLFGLALIPVGISHFVYVSLTTPLIPAWIPFHLGWAYFTGACHLAAGLGLLFGVLPRLAAQLEAAMLGIFTVLVWVPAVITAPGTRFNWTELWLSWALTVATAVVALHTSSRHAQGAQPASPRGHGSA